MRKIGNHDAEDYFAGFMAKMSATAIVLITLLLIENVIPDSVPISIMLGALDAIIFSYIIMFFRTPLWFKAILSSEDEIGDYHVPILKDRMMRPKTYRNAYSIVGEALGLFHSYPSTFVTMKSLHDDHDSVFVMVHNPTAMITFTIDNNDVIIATRSPLNILEKQSIAFIELTGGHIIPDRNREYDVHIH
jgi:hypothetical protein